MFALEVTGEEMAPNILDGDLVLVDPLHTPRGNAKDLAVLKVKGNYHVCKFTVYGNQIMMIHDNGPIKVVRARDVEIVGKVVKCCFDAAENEESHHDGNVMTSIDETYIVNL